MGKNKGPAGRNVIAVDIGEELLCHSRMMRIKRHDR